MLNCMKAILAINLFAAFAELPQFMEERSSGMRTGVGLEDEADILERRWLVQTNSLCGWDDDTCVQRDPGHLRRAEAGAGEAAGARGGQHPPGQA